MADSLRDKTIGELVDLGWIVVVDEHTDEVVGLRSVMRHWNTLTWSERTFYSAKYGFDGNGVLEVSLSENAANSSELGFAFRPENYGAYVTPEHSLPGSNDRLRRILSQSRAEVISDRYDETALVHFGSDGTVIFTNDYLWGLAVSRDDPLSELDQGHTCHWEASLETWCPTAPWWAVGPDKAVLY